MSMTLDSLKRLYVRELKDLYSAESRILAAMPAIQNASDSGLAAALEHHRQMTLRHIDRLEKRLDELEVEPGGQSTKARAHHGALAPDGGYHDES